jgi:hypothetical protein
LISGQVSATTNRTFGFSGMAAGESRVAAI